MAVMDRMAELEQRLIFFFLLLLKILLEFNSLFFSLVRETKVK